MRRKNVTIIGAGLAGLTCAKSLVDNGFSVEVLEGLPYVGGRASTFRDADGDWIEQGIHLFLGTYSEFKKLLEEVGQPVDKTLFWMDEVRYEVPHESPAVFGVNPFVAPMKTLLGALGQNDFLGPADKVSLAAIGLSGLRGLEALEQRYDGVTIKEVWKRRFGTDDVLEKFIRPFCRAIQFTDAEDFSAYNFLGWLHHVAYHLPHSLLGGYQGARQENIFDPIVRYLTTRGARIRTGVKLSSLIYSDSDERVFRLRTNEGAELLTECTVLAIPAWEITKTLPPALRALTFFDAIDKLPTAPAISVQIWTDKKVTDNSDFVLVAKSPMPVYQDQSRETYPTVNGSRLSLAISPADSYLGWSDEALIQMACDELGKVRPAFREARVVKSVVLRHHKHLVRPLPGAMSSRPTQLTPIPGLFLAGDWTRQDYFGSQEGAVRSGRQSAEEVLRYLKSVG